MTVEQYDAIWKDIDGLVVYNELLQRQIQSQQVEVEQLQQRVMDAWISFARSGTPAHDGIGPWAPYDTHDRITMVFDLECGAQPAPFEEERTVWQSMLAAPASTG